MTVSYMVGDMIVEIKKALKEGRPQAFAHGANCRKIMGAGIAGALARAFPEVPAADMLSNGTQKFTEAYLGGGVFVYNLYTQYQPGANFELSRLKAAVEALEGTGLKAFTIPKIGAGIGGGDWNEIEKVLQESKIHFNVVVLSPLEVPQRSRPE